MAFSRTLGCPDCGHTWTFLAMKRDEANPRCPRCSGRAKGALTAPSIGRGAQPPTSVPIPQSRAKREDLAVRLALEESGHSDINTQQREGDIAVKTVDMGVPKHAPEEIRTGFRNLETDPTVRGQQIAALGAGTPVGDRRRNLGIIGSMKK